MLKKLYSLVVVLILVVLVNGPAAPALASRPPRPEYVFPLPGSTRLNPQTSIIVRYPGFARARQINAANFQVSGSQSGPLAGRAVLADDLATVVFYPDRPFAAGETVSVAITPGWLDVPPGGTYTFSFQVDGLPAPEDGRAAILAPQAEPVPEAIGATVRSPLLQDNLTLPATFPPYTINTPAAAGSPGYYFLAPFQIVPAANYLLIVDGGGEPLYYREMPNGAAAYDFKVQPNGLLSYYDSEIGAFKVLDSSYQQVATYAARNGYSTDLHELQLLPNNHGVFMTYDLKTIDMSLVVPGGNPNATVIGLVFQELDGGGNVVFEWRSWDEGHFAITDADPNIDLTAEIVDYVHGNAIQLDWDGNYLISSRHLCEITKIDRRSGDILWRLGGKHNQFTFTNPDPPEGQVFCYQHDIRRLADGHITLFDNHNTLTPIYSRAMEFQLNEDTKTITQVWEYRSSTPDVFSMAMGNAQRLASGNTVIGWGVTNLGPFVKAQPDISEVTPDGKPVFEMTLEGGYINYRAFRFAWQASPPWPPVLNFKSQAGQITLAASWNGATEASQYEFWASPAGGGPPQLLGTVPKTGFETQWTLAGDLAGYCSFEAVALDKSGAALQSTGSLSTVGCQPYRRLIPIVSP